MEPAVHYFNDRCSISLLPEPLSRHILQNNLLTQSREKVSFCGMITCEKTVNIFFPRQHKDRSVKGGDQAISNFFKALRKYDKEQSNLLKSDEDDSPFVGNQTLSAIYSLIEDYRNYGLYSRRDKHKLINSGKPDWPKTMTAFQPHLSKSGPVYINYIGAKSRYCVDSEISRIHAYVLKTLDAVYGPILFGAKSYSDDGILLPLQTTLSYMVSELKKELRNVFSDRDIRLIKLLIKIVEDKLCDEMTSVVVGTKSFHSIWELMLKKTISGTVELNDRLPLPVYLTENNEPLPAIRNAQKTDIIVENSEKNLFAVVDAKYYDATSIGNAPRWHDLVKQFFYEKAISSIYPEATVKNYFIFPGSKAYFETVYMGNRKDLSRIGNYADISCIYIEPSVVIHSYVTGAKLQKLSVELNS